MAEKSESLDDKDAVYRQLEQLKKERDTYKDLFDKSSELIYIHDENGTFIDVNNAVVAKYGFTKEEIIGSDPSIFSLPEANDLDDVAAKTQMVWSGGEPQILEWWSQKKDKSVFIKELVLNKGRYMGRDVIIATGRDISQRKAAEKKLQKINKELRESNNALDTFVYSASHDLKAPLSSILGLLDLMQGEDPSTYPAFLEKIKISAHRLTAFISDLVQYSKNARMEVVSEEVVIDQLVDEIMESLEYMPGYQSIEKKINVTVSILATDSYRLSVILSNLIANAIKYQDQGKPSQLISIKICGDRNQLKIAVADNGIGIKKEHQRKVFHMFQRATDQKSGSGLGLFLVKEAVDKLGGEITFDSTFGEGTTFKVTIPASYP